MIQRVETNNHDQPSNVVMDSAAPFTLADLAKYLLSPKENNFVRSFIAYARLFLNLLRVNIGRNVLP